MYLGSRLLSCTPGFMFSRPLHSCSCSDPEVNISKPEALIFPQFWSKDFDCKESYCKRWQPHPFTLLRPKALELSLMLNHCHSTCNLLANASVFKVCLESDHFPLYPLLFLWTEPPSLAWITVMAPPVNMPSIVLAPYILFSI